jgi:GcrA cell cycle regulator
MFWTDERIAELKDRWRKNETYREIAIHLGAVSRNAVIGKAHRLKLFRLGDAIRTAIQKSNQRRSSRNGMVLRRRQAGEMGEPMAEPAPPIFDHPKLLLALRDGDCRWPGAGAGADMLYCGAPAIDGKAYCLHHCRIAFVRPGANPKAPRR